MASPLVSVVLPTYNRAELVVRAINSVLSQTVADLELIVVDDGSTDRTPEALARMGDPRLRVLRLAANQGVAGARNAGIQQARGRFIAFQDSDDLWRPHKLARQMRALAQAGPGVGVCYCGLWRREPGRQIYVPGARTSIYQGQVFSRLLGCNFVSPQTALIGRDHLRGLGQVFDPALPPLEDWDLFLRLARAGCRFILVNEPLVESQLRGDSISADASRLLRAHQRLIDKHLPALAGRPWLRGRLWRSLAASHYALGLNLAAQGRKSQARSHFKLAWRRSPFHPKYLCSWAVSRGDPAWWLRALALRRGWSSSLPRAEQDGS